MVIESGKNNRCGIFLFYDRDGVVDDYIPYMLEDLRKSLSFLLVVCNGSPSESGIAKLNAVADEVFIRENEGFDVGGYRDGLFHIGWDCLCTFDEVVMLNYTFFGALYPFRECFDAMSSRDVDFWGLTKHHKFDTDPYGAISYGYIPEHIQSHFLVVRQSLIKSEDYQSFINNMKNPTSYVESICGYEAVFTKIFEDKGYRWDVYINSDRFIDYTYSPVMFHIKDLLEEDRCPIIKRRSFFTEYNDYLLNSCGESSVVAYNYIRENISYDVNMIWDNILRLENMSEVNRVMQLGYCNASDMSYTDRELRDLTICVWVKSLECLEFYECFLINVASDYKLCLYGSQELTDGIIEYVKYLGTNKKFKTNNANVCNYQEFLKVVTDDIRNDIGTEYLMVLVIDDKGDEKPYSNKISNIYKDWSCLVSSRAYVTNVLYDFDSNERMGLGVPPIPDFGSYYESLSDGWCGRYEDVQEYLQKISIHPNISKDIEPIIPVGGNFIIKTDIVKSNIWQKAMEIKVDEQIFLLSLVEIVRASGYYTGTLYSNDYAAIELTNSDYMLREMNKAVFEKHGSNYYCVVRDRLEKNELIEDILKASPLPLKMRLKRGVKKIMPKKMYNSLKVIYKKIRGRVRFL